VSSKTVQLFGKDVKIRTGEGGQVMFDRESFMNAMGKARAQRIFKELREMLEFLGEDGADELINGGKERLLCGLVMSNKGASDDLKAYAMAWSDAHELLTEGA